MRLLLGRRQLVSAGVAAAATPGLRSLAFAAPVGRAPLLVLVNLRGGMDGLHALSPADDRDFIETRAEALRSATAGEQAGHRLDASPATDFRLHREAGPLAAIWREGRMAIWPAAGVPMPTRSHFEAQAMLGAGHGLASEGSGGGGWLGTWAERAAAGDQRIAALSVQGGLAPELQGGRRGIGIASLQQGLAPPGGAFGAAVLAALHRDGHGAAAIAGRAALAGLQELDALLPREADGRVRPYQPAHGADYGPSQGFGRALAVVAETARLSPGLVAATVDLGGWDTHEGQAGRIGERLRVLAGGLGAFDADLADLPRPFTVVVVSEFGRRLRANRSGGTDHGRAGVMLAFGGGAGRRFGLARHFGSWPGLAPDALEEGVDLRVATDYRAVFRQVVAELAPGGPAAFG